MDNFTVRVHYDRTHVTPHQVNLAIASHRFEFVPWALRHVTSRSVLTRPWRLGATAQQNTLLSGISMFSTRAFNAGGLACFSVAKPWNLLKTSKIVCLQGFWLTGALRQVHSLRYASTAADRGGRQELMISEAQADQIYTDLIHNIQTRDSADPRWVSVTIN